MKVQLGVSLIIVGLVLPVIAFFVIRKILKDKNSKLKGEKFHKEGHSRMEILKEGTVSTISLPPQLINLANSASITYIFEDTHLRKLKNPISKEDSLKEGAGENKEEGKDQSEEKEGGLEVILEEEKEGEHMNEENGRSFNAN